MKKLVWVTATLALGAFSTQASLIAGDSLTVDFDNASDINGFAVVRDDTPSSGTLGIGQNPAKGTGSPVSGGVEAINVGTVNGANDLAALYTPGGTASTTGHISLNSGDTLTLTLKFFAADVSLASTPRLGIASAADVNTATSNGTVLDINSGKDIIGGTTSGNYADGIAVNVATGGNKTFNISDVVGGGGRTFTTDPNGPYDLINSTWYQFVAQITKSTTADMFDVSAVLNQLNADGTALNSQIGSVATTITNAGLYGDDVIAGFTVVHTGAPATVSNEYDDFTIAIVPEPGTLGLLGIGLMVFLARTRRHSRNGR